MKTLAIEMSTDTGSLALLSGRDVVAQRCWTESHAERQVFFAALAELFEAERLDPAEVDRIAVGVGPGSFAGLRMAVAAACGLAAPGGRTVMGIGSPDAVAADVLAVSDAEEVVVWGDARRQELWAVRFRRGAEWPERQGAMAVGAMTVLPEDWARDRALWVTADWDRIGGRLAALRPAGVTLREHRAIPGAGAVGRLAVARCERGAATEPLEPVYVHPAVTVAPKETDGGTRMDGQEKA